MRSAHRLCFLAPAVLAVATTGCAAMPDIRADRDPRVDLKSYQTFGFLERPASVYSQYTSLMSVHLRQATRDQLQRLGYVYSETSPDLKVNFFVKLQDRQELRSSAPAGIVGYRAWPAASLETVEFRQGTLTIDLVDARKNALVWRGVAEGRVSRDAGKHAGRTVDTTVREIFAGFPNGI